MKRSVIIIDFQTGKRYFVEDIEKLKRECTPEEKEKLAWNIKKGFPDSSTKEPDK